MFMNNYMITEILEHQFVAYIFWYSFIDGTEEGTPADLKVYIDSSLSNDHTYYGNGCSGFKIYSSPCASPIVKDGDNEDQKIGVYYNFPAATTDAGGTTTSDNTNIPDTFCPLGWQLPYGGRGGDYYDQSRSWRYLLDTYSITYNENNPSAIIAIRSYPFSNANSGRFLWDSGYLNDAGASLFQWSTTAYNNIGYMMYVNNLKITVTDTDNKSHGNSLRCLLCLLRDPSSTARRQGRM